MNGYMCNNSNTRLRHFDFSPTSAQAEDAESKLNEKNEETKAHANVTWADYKSLVQASRKALDREEKERMGLEPSCPGSDIRVTALGTGSAMPSKYRNGEVVWKSA